MDKRRQEKELIPIEVYRNQSIGNTVYSTEYPFLLIKERSMPAYCPVQALAALKLIRSSQQLR
jgi:hypothetical protein